MPTARAATTLSLHNPFVTSLEMFPLALIQEW